jgi:hypothetical protein
MFLYKAVYGVRGMGEVLKLEEYGITGRACF